MRILILCFLALCVAGHVIDFESLGAIADDSSLETEWANGALLNSTWNKLEPGDTFVISNKTFHVMGGILVTQDVIDVTFDIQGTLSFSDDRVQWPRAEDSRNDLARSLRIWSSIKNTTRCATAGGLRLWTRCV